MNKFYNMLGLGRKAGKVVYGYDATVSLIKSDTDNILVVLASDASEKTKKNILFECNKYNRDFIEYGEKNAYGKILRKDEVVVLTVTDKNMISYLKNNT